ncbi:MAG: hypothetical protein R8G66_24735 [Cytophagales bacterium]|nr:hypothetical protein [Cytophagales bacterium]
MKYWFYCSFLFLHTISMAQDSPFPYAQIPSYPDTYSSGNILSRMVDGLGYRYYWATEGLKQQDLDYKPSGEARSTFETIQHLYGLSEMILNAAINEPNVRPADWSDLSFRDLRRKTLEQLRQASQLYSKLSEEELAKAQVIFKNGENENAFPLWHIMNGPIADALWHAGQVVSFRRSSGNPMNPNVNVFMGQTRY